MGETIIGGVKNFALALTAMLTASVALAYDGENMAPGIARVQALDAAGGMRVSVLDREYRGTWRRASQARDSALLRLHWRGGRDALRGKPLAVAELHSTDGMRIRCEFVNDADAPTGVCEEDGFRLYYLRGA